jgi:hypothetical protein
MNKIKTRDTVRDIKTFDRAAGVGKHMKNVSVKSKDAVEAAGRQAEQTQDTDHTSPSEYASGQVMDKAKRLTKRTASGLRKNPIGRVSENMNAAKQNIQEAQRQVQNIKDAVRKPASNQPRKEMTRQAQETFRRSALRTRQTRANSAKAVEHSGEAIKQTVHDADKTIKTASRTIKGSATATRKSVKTAGRATKVTVKTAKQTALATRRAAGTAAKSAQVAAQTSRVAARAAAHTAKVTAKVSLAAIKAIIASTKALISVIAAGGWIAVVIILIICMVGLLAGSVFGIFFSGADSGNGYTMPMAIKEINAEYADKIKEIRDSNAHDEVRMSGSRAEWKEVLAVYAVKVNTDLENAQDVATMDESKKELLRSVFWEMNTLNYRTETKEVTEVTVEGDGEDFTSTEQTVTKTILYITVAHKTATEMAGEYGFSAEQNAQLTELLSDEYADLWSAVLYGISNGSEDIVSAALSQIGNVGGQPYWSWYGFGSRVEWCATFVSWCANECGYIDAGIIPKFAACQLQGIPWFKDQGLWQEPGYVPVPGDIIFFDWQGDGHSDHVGIVEYVEGNRVHTVEGNTSNSVARRSYRLDSREICGFGTPMY